MLGIATQGVVVDCATDSRDGQGAWGESSALHLVLFEPRTLLGRQSKQTKTFPKNYLTQRRGGAKYFTGDSLRALRLCVRHVFQAIDDK